MKELSVFIDESGDFGEYSNETPYYIVTLVFHDQENDIGEYVERLDAQLSDCGFHDKYIQHSPHYSQRTTIHKSVYR